MSRFIQFNDTSIDEAFAFLESLLDSAPNFTDFVPKLPNSVCNGQFPPSNMSTDEDGTLHVEVAVAGYSEKEVSLSFEDRHLIVTLNPEEKKAPFKWLQKGIKNSKATIKFLVHDRFDENTIDAKTKDGILSITMKVKEEAKPKTIEIKKE